MTPNNPRMNPYFEIEDHTKKITLILYPLTNTSPLPHPQPLATTILLCFYEFGIFKILHTSELTWYLSPCLISLRSEIKHIDKTFRALHNTLKVHPCCCKRQDFLFCHAELYICISPIYTSPVAVHPRVGT